MKRKEKRSIFRNLRKRMDGGVVLPPSGDATAMVHMRIDGSLTYEPDECFLVHNTDGQHILSSVNSRRYMTIRDLGFVNPGEGCSNA